MSYRVGPEREDEVRSRDTEAVATFDELEEAEGYARFYSDDDEEDHRWVVRDRAGVVVAVYVDGHRQK